MTMTGAIKKLEANGWKLSAEQPSNGIRFSREGQRDIFLRGSVESNYVNYIVIKTYNGANQLDYSSDFRYCDTIKEAMVSA